MKFKIPPGYLILLLGIALGACTDSDSGSSESGDGGGLLGQPEPIDQVPDDFTDVIRDEDTLPEIESIAGLWNNSSTEEGGLVDVYYLEVTSEGAWNNFNYRGDSVDQGENCYDLLPGRVVSLGGMDYQISTPFGSFEITAVVTDGRLVVTNSSGSVTLPAVTGISAVDLNEC